MSTYLKKRFGHCTFAGGFCRTEGTAKEGRGEVRLGEGRGEKGVGGQCWQQGTKGGLQAEYTWV